MAVIIAWLHFIAAIIWIAASIFLGIIGKSTLIFFCVLEGLIFAGCFFYTLGKIYQYTKMNAELTTIVSRNTSLIMQKIEHFEQNATLSSKGQLEHIAGLTSLDNFSNYLIRFKGEIHQIADSQLQQNTLKHLAKVANMPLEQLMTSEVTIKNLGKEKAASIQKRLHASGIIVHIEKQVP